jgi:peptidoglycan/LPS O-acetylase OafA/YrhL
MKNQHENRVLGLDIMRAFAIIFVLLDHGILHVVKFVNYTYYKIFELDGVTIFFVLSGFLIGGILLKTINTTSFGFGDLANFWKRRWFRTLPNYLLILSLLTLYKYYLKDPPTQVYKYFLFIQNFNRPSPEFFGEAWSLAVEEWFYLLIPFILMLCLGLFKRVPKQKLILMMIISVITGVTLFRSCKAAAGHYTDFISWDDNLRKEVITRFDSLMYGFLAAFLRFYNYPIWKKYSRQFFLAGMLLLVLANVYVVKTSDMFFLNYFVLSLNPIGGMMLLPALAKLKTGHPAIVRFFSFFSILSYSIYLLNHTIVQYMVMPVIFKKLHFSPDQDLTHAIITLVLYVGLTLIFSYLLYHFYEKRMTDLREKFSKKEPKPALAARSLS